MALLFAEKGLEVSLQDPSEKVMDHLVSSSERQGFGGRVKKFTGTAQTHLQLQTGLTSYMQSTNLSSTPSAPRESPSSPFPTDPSAILSFQVSSLSSKKVT